MKVSRNIEDSIFANDRLKVVSQEEANKPFSSNDPDFEPTDITPHRLSQTELSDLIRDLDLS